MSCKAKSSAGPSLVLISMVLGFLVGVAASAAGSSFPLLEKQTPLTPSDDLNVLSFGSPVAISGNTVVVGGQFSLPLFPFPRRGAVYVFDRTGGGAWVQKQKLTPLFHMTYDGFGSSLAMDGDTFVVGAPLSDDRGVSSGAAFVISRGVFGFWEGEAILYASDAAFLDGFGSSVAISGDTAVVESRAGTYVFVRSAGIWTQQQKLEPREPRGAIAIAGDTLVVGTPFDNVSGLISGAAHVFARTAGVWTLKQKLTASDAAAGDLFGFSVSVSGDTTFVASARSVYVFGRSGGVWSQHQKLMPSGGVDVNGDAALITVQDGQTGSDPGAAYVFVRSGGVWSEQQKLTASDVDSRGFGRSAAIGPDAAVIGGAGAAYVYESSSTSSLTALGPAQVWVGLRNSDDVGVRFDLRAEVFLNGEPVGSGQIDSVPGGSSGFNNAKLSAIPLTLSAPVTVESGDTFGIEVLVRTACSGSGHGSGTARLWYDGHPVDTGSSRDAGSRFDATIGLSESAYFLRGSFDLDTAAGSAQLFVDKAAGARCGAFNSFGTWRTSLP